MGIADMDFRAAPSITQALQERMKHDVWGYMVMPKSFPEGIVAWNKKRYGITVDPALLDITTGVHPGLVAALRAFSPPGSKVLLTTPTYNGFYGDLRNTGTLPEESVMKVVNGRFTFDYDDFERRISPQHQDLHPLQPAEPDRQRVDAGGADENRRDLPAARRDRARRRNPLRLGHQGPEVHAVRQRCRTRRSSTTASPSRPPASRSASRR